MPLWWLALGTATASPVAPYLGLEWRPLSRGDITWVVEGNGTGLQVGELDGLVRPAASVYGGLWITEQFGAHGSLGVARVQTTTWVEDVYVQRHWGVVRPAVDLRFALLPHDDPRPVPFLLFGGHLDLPSARDVSNGYTAEEQAQADETASIDRARIGALGGRLGVGGTVAVLDGLSLGLQYALAWQRSMFVGDDPTSVTSFVGGEGALLLQLAWPRRGGEDEDDDD